ncbi:MAG: hypothetical protein ACHP79_00665, partial [Terriglobales bacterium]
DKYFVCTVHNMGVRHDVTIRRQDKARPQATRLQLLFLRLRLALPMIRNPLWTSWPSSARSS